MTTATHRPLFRAHRQPARVRCRSRVAGVVTTLLAVVLAAGLASCGGDSKPAGRGADAPAGTTTPSTGRQPSARPSPGCENAPPATAAAGKAQTLDVGGVERTYLLAAPEGRNPAPLIILLHGMGSSAADIGRASGLPARGPAGGAVVVAPDAAGTPTMWRPGADGPDADFLDALVAHVEARHCIDTNRVGIVGFSVGAVFASTYGCARQDRVAAVVTVEVDTPGTCTRPMPILAFHGTADPIVAYDPPPGSTPLGGGSGTEANLAAWAKISRCTTTPVTTEISGKVTRIEWPRCAGGSEVVLYKIIGGGHTWPAEPPDATERVVAFLGRHSLR